MLGHARQLKPTCNTCHKQSKPSHQSHHPVSVAEREHDVDFDIDSDCDFLRYNNWHKCQERILPIALSQLCHEYAAVALAAATTTAAPDDVCDVRGQSVEGSQSNVRDKDNDDVAWAHTMKLINEIQ